MPVLWSLPYPGANIIEPCPECAEHGNPTDVVCRFCGYPFPSRGDAPRALGTPEPPATSVAPPAPLTAIVPGPGNRAKRRRQRAAPIVLGALIITLVAGLVLIPGARDNVPSAVPAVGKNADDVLRQMQGAGIPITAGRPADAKFNEMIDHNDCKSSRSFVRTDTEDTGWGFACVRPSSGAYRRMSSAFDDIPMITGPMFVDDDNGEVVVLGFGWPADASKTIYDAIGGSKGTYLVE